MGTMVCNSMANTYMIIPNETSGMEFDDIAFHPIKKAIEGLNPLCMP